MTTPRKWPGPKLSEAQLHRSVACRRIEAAYNQPLFAEPAPKPKQEALL
jgi:hypothetical protein